MKYQEKVAALAVVFAVDGIAGLDSLTCVVTDTEQVLGNLASLSLNGEKFTNITEMRRAKVRVLPKELGTIMVGTHHVY